MALPLNDLQLITKAFNFAAERHADQRRKGAKAEPYINHPAEVAAILAEHGADAVLIAAAILHDTIEDVGVTYAELAWEFGSFVADVVQEVTDNKTLPKQVRKQLQIEHAAHASPRAKMLKIADKIANLKALLASPPADWAAARIAEYFEWAKKVVDNCRGVNPGLEDAFDKVYVQKGKAVAAVNKSEKPKI